MELQEKAFAYIDANKGKMLELWEDFVNTESGTLYKEDVDKMALLAKETLEGFGASARLIEHANAGNGVLATFGKPTNKAPVCFLGHYDTVFPRGTVAQRPFRIEEGKAYGPGVLDMKGGIVIQFFVAKALMEAGYKDRQIKVLLSGDEETGHPHSNMGEILSAESRGAVAAFNFETGDLNGTLVVGRKGSMSYDIAVKGVSVHAGREPENGRSAILEIAHKVIDIQSCTDYEKGITFNVGKINGGVARNAVPGKAEMEVEVRILNPEQGKEADAQIAAIVAKTYIDGTETTCKKIGGMPPMPRTKGNEAMCELVRQVSFSLGLQEPTPIISGGGSDSAYSVAAGVPTIDQIGVKGQWNHSEREYAVVETLFERAKLVIASVLRLDDLVC